MQENHYVAFTMTEWGMAEQSILMQSCVREVLSELEAMALLCLKDPRLEVMVVPKGGFSVWAYLRLHPQRRIAKKLQPKPETRVLLVLGIAEFESEPPEVFKERLRDHLGHALLYLRSPKAPNDCPDAE